MAAHAVRQKATGSTNVTLDVDEQPFASVSVAVYEPAAKPDVVVTLDSPLLHKYVQPATPPDGDTSATPSDSPKQLTSAPFCCKIEADDVTATGATNVTLDVDEQPFASVTVAVYEPAAKPDVVVTLDSPLLHKYAQPATPPDGDTSATPSDSPKQLTSAPFCCKIEADDVTATGSTNVTLDIDEQPFASNTVTVYEPADKPDVVVTLASPLLHKYVQPPTPPDTNTSATPSDSPKQLTSAPF
jgi:hypothetical protein